MIKKDKNKDDRFENYPLPTEQDRQQNHQPEYIDQQPNDFHDKSISDIPASKTPEEKKRTEDDEDDRGLA